ncbi:unnamed protein product [Acanthoscelides obtectus]|uniref:Tyr recombinase domain-containing protein n=1 Tax=Acanthoscelides obtectus TaxID=200917 RepID=A0A9P0KWU9_ACAOB|nr:unnamed protein product [Acanthoscelides obtectus]CAK1650669.1 hypothetical protein AOBTE_LOCUS16856 [Acanthoscelides obtectus]
MERAPLEETTPPMEEPYPGCSNFIRQIYSRKNISETSIEIIVGSFSQNTLKQYNSTFSKWWSFCTGNTNIIFQADAHNILNFLTQEFEKGATITTINTHKSALNLLSEAGKSVEVERFIKGVFKARPSFPRYEEIWDPYPVLEMLEKLHPLESLDLTNLSVKLVLLLALGTAQRVQTLAKIKLSNILSSEDGLKIMITDILKTSAPKRPQPVLIFPFFKEKPELCIATTILHYIKRTKLFRKSENSLILTVKKPQHPATTQTISRWIKYGLGKNGVDINKFKGHSTRHASSSAAFKTGLNIEIIRNSAGWTEKSSSFARFYNRPVSAKETPFACYIETLTKS